LIISGVWLKFGGAYSSCTFPSCTSPTLEWWQCQWPQTTSPL